MVTRSTHGLDTPRGARWWELAACRGQAPDMDTLDATDALYLIYRFCIRCPVLADCDADAHTVAAAPLTGWGNSTSAPDGIWGGRLWRNGKPRTAPLDQPQRPVCGRHPGIAAHRAAGELPCVDCYQLERQRHRRQYASRQTRLEQPA